MTYSRLSPTADEKRRGTMPSRGVAAPRLSHRPVIFRRVLSAGQTPGRSVQASSTGEATPLTQGNKQPQTHSASRRAGAESRRSLSTRLSEPVIADEVIFWSLDNSSGKKILKASRSVQESARAEIEKPLAWTRGDVRGPGCCSCRACVFRTHDGDPGRFGF